MPTPLPQNQIVDASQALSLLAPIFFGSGKTTTTEGSVSTKPGLSQEQSVFNTATGNANNPAITDAIVQNIMNQAAIAFAPTVGQQNNAGMYNSNVLQMLSAMAQGQATSQSAQAVLNYKTSQQQIALNASNKLLETNKQTTGTKQTAPILSPSMLLQGGAGLLANKVLGPQIDKALNAVGLGPSTSTGSTGLQLAGGAGRAGEGATGLPAETQFPATTDSVLTPSGVGTQPTAAILPSAETSALDGSGGAITESGLPDGALNAASSAPVGGVDSAGGFASETSIAGDTLSGDLSAAGNLVDTSAIDAAASTGVLDIGADAGVSTAVDAAGIGADLAGSAGVDLSAFGGIGADLAGSAAADLGAGAAVDLAAFGGIGADLGISAGVDLAAFGGIGADVAGAAIGGEVAADVGGEVALDLLPLLAWIICTELVRQGRMSKKWYVTGSKKFASYPEIGKNGYYVWAIPCVRHLRKYPNSWFSFCLERIFNWRAEYIAATYGVRGARKLWKGRIVSAVLYPSCWILGHILWPFKKFDYTSVYSKESA